MDRQEHRRILESLVHSQLSISSEHAYQKEKHWAIKQNLLDQMKDGETGLCVM